ncbi:fibrinogen silencer-binding protein [Boleophthalmus pectinirostris]|uniref:fibrinogen silencer-binding protein n=1 Tax=Boleophthalmus pectinirostris TaxID=150288 RepID=UPI0024317BC7|nr:fibrinogen silencer-binding protein [Boleophthalmus pectinirostris]
MFDSGKEKKNYRCVGVSPSFKMDQGKTAAEHPGKCLGSASFSLDQERAAAVAENMGAKSLNSLGVGQERVRAEHSDGSSLSSIGFVDHERLGQDHADGNGTADFGLLKGDSFRPDLVCVSPLYKKMITNKMATSMIGSNSMFLSSMVGKARSSNFTLSEKLDLLQLVRPHIRILEEHTNKHAVIVDKNKCWETVAEQYNTLGGDRPHRTAQGLRTLYKRLKESAKQEVMLRRHAQPEYRSNISEPTRRIMEMIPHLFHHVPFMDKEPALYRLMINKHGVPIEHPGSSSSLAGLQDFSDVQNMSQEQIQSESDSEARPSSDDHAPNMRPEMGQEGGEEEEGEQELSSNQDYDASLSPDSVNMPMPVSPVAIRNDLYPNNIYPQHEVERFQSLQLSREEQELVLSNHRKVALYLQEKREALKRKQELEEELIRAKITVEMLRAERLRQGLSLPQ